MREAAPVTGPVVAWLGDDMTGSVDVLEALTWLGVSAALFIDAPTPEDLAALGDVQCVGIAGMTRTLGPDGIRAEVAQAIARVAPHGAPLFHYKICSTFDSSPTEGSIGAGIEELLERTGAPFVPVLPAAPRLGRHTAFGTHFARSGFDSPVHRLDRHPTMRCHPVTPMDESELAVHLAKQTSLPVGLLDVLALRGGVKAASARLDALVAGGARVVIVDAIDDGDMAVVGGVLWEQARRLRADGRVLPVAASAGLEHALAAHWRETGALAAEAPPSSAPEVARLVAVAGSRSPVTDRQIARAVERGFAEVAPPLEAFVDGSEEEAVAAALPAALEALWEGRSVVVHSAGHALGGGARAGASAAPAAGGAPAGDGASAAAARAGAALPADARARIGAALGAIAERLVVEASATRLAVCGGDTSGHVARRLGVRAVSAVAQFAPAMPICRAHAPGRAADGLEILFKGGQTGTVDLLDDVRRGRTTPIREEEVATT